MSLDPGWLNDAVGMFIRDDGDWDHHACEFLDVFYGRDGDREGQAAMIREEPELVESARPDAYLGAVGEHLARRWGLPIPAWVRHPARYLATASRPRGSCPTSGTCAATCCA